MFTKMRLALFAVVVIAAAAAGCKSSSGCSTCGAKAVLPESPLEVKAEAIKQA